MAKSLDKDPLEEIDNWTQLITSGHWIEFVKLLRQRKDYLQKEVNTKVREQNLIEAYGMLCKFDDIDKTLEIVKDKVESLRKEK